MEELKLFKNWVVTYTQDKIPLNPLSMRRADTTDSSTWADYDTADACVVRNQHLTLGFVLTNSPFSCADLDTYKTKDQNLIQEHRQIYEYLNTYSELSPNNGVHCIGKAKIPDSKKLGRELIELLGNGRYVTVTKRSLNGTNIYDRQSEFDAMYRYITEKQKQLIPDEPPDGNELLPDQEVLRMASAAENGLLFRDLFDGRWQSMYASQSEADQALVDIIAFYTDSKLQVARLFHQSELGKRKKAMRKDYLFHPKWGIITRSFDKKLPKLSLDDLQNKFKQLAYTASANELKAAFDSKQTYREKLDKLPDFVQDDYLNFDFEFPPGMVGEIANFIFQNAVHPVREVAITGAIAFLAGICGRGWNISNTGLNHYIAVLAPTGGGKEGAASGIELLATYVRAKTESIDNYLGASAIASPQALLRQLVQTPCFVSHVGEMGFWMQKLTDSHAKQNEGMMRQLLLDLFMKSGKNDVWRGSIYADKNKNIDSIKSPAFTLYGDATPDTFYAALDEENIEEGFVSRFTIVECDPEQKSKFNELHGQIKPADTLVDRIVVMIRHSLNMESAVGKEKDEAKDKEVKAAILIKETPDAHRAQMQFLDECDKKIEADRESPEAKIYSRAHLRLLRLAGLLAVGINPMDPEITVECVEWARKFIVHGIAKVTWRFEQGRVGEKGLYLDQQRTLKRWIRKYWEQGWSEKVFHDWNIDKEMYNAKLITRRYLETKCLPVICFKKARNPIGDFEQGLRSLEHSGVLLKLNMAQIKDSGRTGMAYYITDFDALKEPKMKRQRK